MSSDLREHVEAWMLKAEHDIISADRLIGIEPMILDSACFHCQQAIEKLLKAFLCYKEQDIERTHNIRFLLEKCSEFDLSFETLDPRNINMYAVWGRYPDDTLMPTTEEAKYFFQLANQVNAMVKERLIFLP